MTKLAWRGLIASVAMLIAIWFSLDGFVPTSPLNVRGDVPYHPMVRDRGVSTRDARATATTSTNALVLRVIDGDTFEAAIDGESGKLKVRLLGVNTPESVDPRRPVECFGKEASRFLRELVEGKRIRLDEDTQADDRDKYGRLLRNVFLEDGRDVNALMVKQGYAYAYLAFPLDKQRKNELRRLQGEAKMNQSGLWNVDTCGGLK